MEGSPLKVIIVGGSVAGLTLAHCLHRANIDHVVLEKRPEIAPQEGASIGLWPTGGQVLDQLGLWEEIAEGTQPLRVHNVLYPDGSGFSHDVLNRVYERFGYGLTFVERQRLLETLYRRYPDHSRILVNKAVVEIRQTSSGVCVVTEDGTVYQGSLVVGADGVHSRVRSEMWRLTELQNPGRITPKEKKRMTTEYSCVFGISSAIPGLRKGEHGNVFGDGVTVLTFHGEDRVFWFVVSKMDKKYTYPNIPRFSSKDAEELCGRFAAIRLVDGVCVRDLWESRRVASITAMEEGLFEAWYFGRMVLLGDAVRKMTVNMGQGANCAIEDAAVLATLLDRLVQPNKNSAPSEAEIEALLREFRTLRYARSKAIYGQTMFGVRLYTRDGILKTLMGRYVMPRKIDHMADATSTLMADGPVVGFLPLPRRWGTGWESYRSLKNGDSHWSPRKMVFLALGMSVLAYGYLRH
ncbi:FAD-dependent monooxygenase spyC [Aspergillus mulundensis]|uniref:FAD-binding domain-containing protein n=1 Tax=Aspergillus mulundensis TaxID=1810919 RepID=A0A3D8T5B2_9EURO|nr:Uncharacterized protein DSM5745_01041 [Aspergillus mulundensis]RDW93719.1 Uncharacterized protein DSM5745_01041 [Aspergillus mulundensis]